MAKKDRVPYFFYANKMKFNEALYCTATKNVNLRAFSVQTFQNEPRFGYKISIRARLEKTTTIKRIAVQNTIYIYIYNKHVCLIEGTPLIPLKLHISLWHGGV